jgi:hypothetical protein
MQSKSGEKLIKMIITKRKERRSLGIQRQIGGQY